MTTRAELRDKVTLSDCGYNSFLNTAVAIALYPNDDLENACTRVVHAQVGTSDTGATLENRCKDCATFFSDLWKWFSDYDPGFDMTECVQLAYIEDGVGYYSVTFRYGRQTLDRQFRDDIDVDSFEAEMDNITLQFAKVPARTQAMSLVDDLKGRIPS